LGLQNKFPGKKNKNMEWQRENMATSGIIKSFDPIKQSFQCFNFDGSIKTPVFVIQKSSIMCQFL
jgi:hypothetical protein